MMPLKLGEASADCTMEPSDRAGQVAASCATRQQASVLHLGGLRQGQSANYRRATNLTLRLVRSLNESLVNDGALLWFHLDFAARQVFKLAAGGFVAVCIELRCSVCGWSLCYDQPLLRKGPPWKEIDSVICQSLNARPQHGPRTSPLSRPTRVKRWSLWLLDRQPPGSGPSLIALCECRQHRNSLQGSLPARSPGANEFKAVAKWS